MGFYLIYVLLFAAFLGLIPASIAQKKGHNFALWWFYGWMLFIVAIIHVQYIEDLTIKSDTDFLIKKTSTEMNNVVDELKKLKELKDAGIITKEEFVAKKRQILGL